MQISIRSRYGLRAMVYLAKAQRTCSAKEICQKEEIPFDFLEKIFSRLQQAGLIKSQRGARGGYFLAKPPRKISIREILRALENEEIFSVLCKRKHRFSKKKCPIKKVWKRIRETLSSTLEKITLADLCEKK
ncbi:Rrf2 family transcriptional regulator [bacterium]|nr:Rrf2 family transcriptional regulator [bacterium]